MAGVSLAPAAADAAHPLTYAQWSLRFALDVGAYDVETVEVEEPHESFQCPVCRSVNDWPGCCSVECQYAWEGYSDPREYEVGFGG